MKQSIWTLGAALFLGASALCLQAEENKSADKVCEKQCTPCTCTICACKGCAEAPKEKCCAEKEACCASKACGAEAKDCACSKDAAKTDGK